MNLSDDFLLSRVGARDDVHDRINGVYTSVYVMNGRLVVRYEDATTHEVTVRKWTLTPVERGEA